MSQYIFQWCSWCFQKTQHKLVEKHTITRNDYQCMECKNYTVKCRLCDKMAKSKPKYSTAKGIYSSLKDNWTDEFCAEHDGTIASFEKLNLKLSKLEDYEVIFSREIVNAVKITKIAAGCIAGIIVFGPAAYWAAPEIAAALGSANLLGAAGTSTAISSLSGAALTSASLAALGPGGMAAGIVFISAAGASLGGVAGGVVSNGYFGEIEDFHIHKVKSGEGPALIFINGFLSQKKQNANDWLQATKKHFANNPCYHVTWESSALYEMGGMIGKGAGDKVFTQNMKKFAKRGAKNAAKKLSPLSVAMLVKNIVGNPWHRSMVKASKTGILLADLISRNVEGNEFILMGHSLGARVIYYLLNTISTKTNKFIKDVYLLGGAVDKEDIEGWELAIGGLYGNIYNIYSKNDHTLKYIYKGANLLTSNPVGLGPIRHVDNRIVNFDATSFVKGHMFHKQRFSAVLDAMHSS